MTQQERILSYLSDQRTRTTEEITNVLGLPRKRVTSLLLIMKYRSRVVQCQPLYIGSPSLWRIDPNNHHG